MTTKPDPEAGLGMGLLVRTAAPWLPGCLHLSMLRSYDDLCGERNDCVGRLVGNGVGFPEEGHEI